MWLVVVGAIVLVLVITLISESLGHDISKPSSSLQEYKRDRDELVNRWFSGKHRPDDEERMFEEFYDGDIDAPEWN